MNLTKLLILVISVNIISISYAKRYKNISYGLDKRQTFDLFTPSDHKEKSSLVVYIHGGGFWQGSKDEMSNSTYMIRNLNKSNIAFASINYRFLSTTPLQKIMKEDIAGFIQFIKHESNKYNINKNRIMVYGESAGGSASLWLGVHPDIKVPGHVNPIKRESSRVFAIGHINAQLSYDFVDWFDFYGKSRVKKYMKSQMYSRYHFKNYSSLYTAEGKKVRETLNMYNQMTRDDPPMIFWNSLSDNMNKDYNHFIHSPLHAKNLYRRANELGIKSELHTKYYFLPMIPKHKAVIDFFKSLL